MSETYAGGIYKGADGMYHDANGNQIPEVDALRILSGEQPLPEVTLETELPEETADETTAIDTEDAEEDLAVAAVRAKRKKATPPA